jgi:hypothetical protein
LDVEGSFLSLYGVLHWSLSSADEKRVPIFTIVVFKLRFKPWLKLRVRLPIVADDVMGKTIDDVGKVQIVVILKIGLHCSSTVAQIAHPVATYSREC